MTKKYKYNGYDIIMISSCGQIKTVYPEDEVELDDNDVKFQSLVNFEEIKLENKKIKSKESD